MSRPELGSVLPVGTRPLQMSGIVTWLLRSRPTSWSFGRGGRIKRPGSPAFPGLDGALHSADSGVPLIVPRQEFFPILLFAEELSCNIPAS